MLDAAIQTVGDMEEDQVGEHPPPPPRVTIKLENVAAEDDSTAAPQDSIQDLLEAAMSNMADNEYPCPLCGHKFPSLFNLRNHIIGTHQSSSNNRNVGRKLKRRKVKKNLLTAKKKPWCNFCWIKFNDLKQYQLHKRTLHPNLSMKTFKEAQNSRKGKSVVKRKLKQRIALHSKKVSILDKDEEGEKIVDLDKINTQNIVRLSPLKYSQSIASTYKLEKRRSIQSQFQNHCSPAEATEDIASSIIMGDTVSLTEKEESPFLISEGSKASDVDRNCEPIKAIKLFKNKYNDTYSTLADSEEDIENSKHKQDGRKRGDEVSDPEFQLPFKPNPSLDNLTISKNKPSRKREDWAMKRKEWIEASPLPIKELRVVLTERVDQVRYIDYTGVYHCTELDKLRISVADFHREMDLLVKIPIPSQSRTNTTEENISQQPDSLLKSVAVTEAIPTSAEVVENVAESCEDEETEDKETTPEADEDNNEATLPDLETVREGDDDLRAEAECEEMCLLCQQPTKYFNKHITIFHNMNLENYFKIFPRESLKRQIPQPKSKKFLKTVLRDCYTNVLKQSEQSQGRTLVDDGQADPAEPLQGAASSSAAVAGPWYETKRSTCLHCGKTFWHGAFIKHVRAEHKQTVREYCARFPGAEVAVPQYRCRVPGCGVLVAHYCSPISGHLSARHGLTMTAYRDAHHPEDAPDSARRRAALTAAASRSGVVFTCKICGAATRCDYAVIKKHLETHQLTWAQYQEWTPDQTQDTNTNTSPGSLIKPKVEHIDVDEPASMTVSDVNPTPTTNPLKLSFESNIKVSLPTEDSNASKSIKKPSVVVVDNMIAPWYNKCKWTCLLCYKTFCSGFWRHVNEQHFMKKDEYLADYSRQGITIVTYSCRVCGERLPWTGTNISAHVKTHGMTLNDYESQFNEKDRFAAENNPVSKIQGSDEVPREAGDSEGKMWYNRCEYRCQLCSGVLHSSAAFTRHLQHAHTTDPVQYSRQYLQRGITMYRYSTVHTVQYSTVHTVQ